MPIRQLEYQITEETLPLSLIRDCRIGIEGNSWLRKVLKVKGPDQSSIDKIRMLSIVYPLVASLVALGGMPPYQTLSNVIKKELDGFKANGITPFFVFNGLNTKRDHPFSKEDTRPVKRDAAWEKYGRGDKSAALGLWQSSNSVSQGDYQSMTDNNVEFMRAPYSSWAQLQYLENHPKQLIHSVCAGLDMLMWKVERVITHFDFAKGFFSFVDKGKLLYNLGISEEMFLDVAIISGFDWIETFPVIDVKQGGDTIFDFSYALDIVKTSSVFQYEGHPQVIALNYIPTFVRTRNLVRHHLILTEEGKVLPLTPTGPQIDLNEMFGPRLPNEIYYYLSQGMISPNVLNSLIGGFVEGHPLCSGDAPGYRDFITSDRVAIWRGNATGLLLKYLNRGINSPKCMYWFEGISGEGYDVGRGGSGVGNWEKGSKRMPLGKTASWINESRKRLKVDGNADVRFAIESTGVLDKVANVAPLDVGLPIVWPTSAFQIASLVFVRVAEVIGYVKTGATGETKVQAPGAALLAGGGKKRGGHEGLVTFIELLLCGGISVKSGSGSGDHISLITRVMSMIGLEGVSGTVAIPVGYSKSLLEFNSFVKVVNRSLRNVFEMALLGLAIEYRGDEELATRAFVQAGYKNHSFADEGCGAGLLFLEYLNLVESGVEKGAAFSQTEEVFKGYVDFKSQFDAGVLFWAGCLSVVRELGKSGEITKEFGAAFSAADAWFATVRK